MSWKAEPKVLFLDDEQERAERFLQIHPNAAWVKTAHECIDLLKDSWDMVSLDHDLGGERYVDSGRIDCGMEVVRWLSETKPEHLKRTHFVVHSLNADAALDMLNLLKTSGYKCTYRPFISLDLG